MIPPCKMIQIVTRCHWRVPSFFAPSTAPLIRLNLRRPLKISTTPLTKMASLWSTDTKNAINLGKGHPNPSLFPLQKIQDAFAKVACAPDAPVAMMQYGRMQGPLPLCNSISEWIKRVSGRSDNLPTPDNIMVTNGSGPGMSLVAQLYSSPGDLIFVDSPGYFLAYYTFKDCRLTVVNIPTDEHGMDVDYVQKLLEQGKKPSLLYTVPIANNPTGSSMTNERKRRLVELARQHSFKILADEVYQFLEFGDQFPTSLFEYDDPSNPAVFSINSFSKLLGPGLRLGWIATHKKHVDRILESGPLHSGGGLNPFMGTIVAELIDNGFVEKQVSKLCTHYQSACDALCDAIDKYVCTAVRDDEHVVYQRPCGGFFCFITLPERFDTQKLLKVAQSCGVSYFAGCNSSPDKTQFKSSIRLCFAFCEKPMMVEGVKRLGEAIKKYVE